MMDSHSCDRGSNAVQGKSHNKLGSDSLNNVHLNQISQLLN